MIDALAIPPLLRNSLRPFVAPHEWPNLIRRMRDPDRLMKAEPLSAFKATRLSFANILARRMITEQWNIRTETFTCDEEGDGHGVYRIDAGGHAMTYLVRCYRWDGVEKVGRRSDGAARDMFGAIFLGNPGDERIREEIDAFNMRDPALMRTRSDVTGWTPASRMCATFRSCCRRSRRRSSTRARCARQRNGVYFAQRRLSRQRPAGIAVAGGPA